MKPNPTTTNGRHEHPPHTRAAQPNGEQATQQTARPDRATRPEPTARLGQATTSGTTGQPARRVGVLDRTALHLGVALIKWGRRPARRTLTTEAWDARAERQRADDLRRAMMLPPRL